MFGSMPLFSTPLPPTEPPKDVPPPTPVNFPHYFPEVTGAAARSTSSDPSSGTATAVGQRRQQKKRLTAVLQSIVRPTEIALRHFEALGLHVQPDADPASVIPDYHSLVPDFAAWDDISYDDARNLNESTRRPISNGSRSPGIQTYLDRKRELSIDNAAAYRSVRRMQPLKPGQPPVRLGNAYEFYRHLENFSAFWDDTSMTPPPSKEPSGPSGSSSTAADAPDENPANRQGSVIKGEDDRDDGNESGGDGDSVSSASSTAVTTDSESKPSSPAKDGPSPVPEVRFYRTSTGAQMPPEFRLNIITAFLKLVAYDFGCNVSAPRMEPRLYLNAGTLPAVDAQGQKGNAKGQQEQQRDEIGQLRKPSKPPSSYFSSGCIFVFRSPTTREAARAGIVEGPLAAVSARHTTTFLGPEERAALPSHDADKDSSIDLARELVAALLTAQHRAREGRAERRLGEGEWWATKPRWGGGSGGPIGREVDAAPNTDDAVDSSSKAEGSGDGGSRGSSSSRGGNITGGGGGGVSSPGGFEGSGAGPGPGALGGGGLRSLGGITGMPVRGAAAPNKKPRKGLAIYDNYRMVRPPSSSWDKKTRYMAIGRARGAAHDDVFVVSALFHHMAIVRVRVPLRLLRALDGGEDEQDEAGDEQGWGRLEMVRSRWYDFFKVEDRLEAMRLAWAMMAFLMRKDEEQDGAGEDVKMRDAA